MDTSQKKKYMTNKYRINAEISQKIKNETIT